jgi:hypothetical protein
MHHTISLVITTLKVVITGRVRLIYYVLPCGKHFRSLANFVGCVVGFLNVLEIRLRSLLLAALLSFEIETVSVAKADRLHDQETG